MDSKLAGIDGKQVDCVQSIYHRGGFLRGFTVRFTDGSLLRIDARTDWNDVWIEVRAVCGFINVKARMCVRPLGHEGMHGDDVEPFHQAARARKETL